MKFNSVEEMKISAIQIQLLRETFIGVGSCVDLLIFRIGSRAKTFPLRKMCQVSCDR